MYYDTIIIPNAERSFFDILCNCAKYILRNQNGKLKTCCNKLLSQRYGIETVP